MLILDCDIENLRETISQNSLFHKWTESPAAILILTFSERANTRFAPTMAREPASDVGVNLVFTRKYPVLGDFDGALGIHPGLRHSLLGLI